jgi:uncharacterized protein (TIGR02246 family)
MFGFNELVKHASMRSQTMSGHCCQRGAAVPTPLEVETQAMMDQMAAACRAGDAAGCAALFTTDATFFSPYAIATRGRDAIEALHRVWTAEANSKRLTVVEAGHSGDLGWCLAAYSEEDVTGNGTALSTLVRQPDGNWQIRLCSLNSDVPPLSGA